MLIYILVPHLNTCDVVVITNTCAMCGKPIHSSPIVDIVNGTSYSFEKEQCRLLLRKLKSVYGAEFCVELTT